MVYYYLGYFAQKLGQEQKAADYYKLAAEMSPEYCFPFQSEAIDVLRAAMKANPRDARAPYYLGNLLYDWQPEEAVKLWEQSAALDGSNAIVLRNLAIAYSHQSAPLSRFGRGAGGEGRRATRDSQRPSPAWRRPSRSSGNTPFTLPNSTNCTPPPARRWKSGWPCSKRHRTLSPAAMMPSRG